MITLARPNFRLSDTGWGDCLPIDLAAVLNSVIAEFVGCLDLSRLPVKPVIVLPSPNDFPDILKTPHIDYVRLSSRAKFYAKHAYQFSHELCHHVVDSNFFGNIDKFGWIEETLCELTSIWTLENMGVTWTTNAPHANWTDYGAALTSYAHSVKSNPAAVIEGDFKDWLRARIELLYADRVRREDNLVIALQLLPIFRAHPELWQSIQYIRQIAVTNEMTWNEFLTSWQQQLPADLQQTFQLVIDALSI